MKGRSCRHLHGSDVLRLRFMPRDLNGQQISNLNAAVIMLLRLEKRPQY